MQPIQAPVSLDALNEKREMAANLIREALENRNLTQLETNAGTVKIVYGKTSAAPYDLLTFGTEEYPRTTIEWSIGDGEQGQYVYQDFHHWWLNPTVDEVIDLLESWNAIRAAFAKHDERVKEASAIEIE